MMGCICYNHTFLREEEILAWNLRLPLYAPISEKRDSENLWTAKETRGSHPRCCYFPRGLHLHLCWHYVLGLQSEAAAPVFHVKSLLKSNIAWALSRQEKKNHHRIFLEIVRH